MAIQSRVNALKSVRVLGPQPRRSKPCSFPDQRVGWVDLHSGTQRCGQDLDQCVDSFVRLSKTFNLCNGVQHGSVVPSIVEAPDPGAAPASHVLREIHGNLTAETRSTLVSRHATSPKVIGYRCFDLFQRETPDSDSLLIQSHGCLRLEEPHLLGPHTDPCRSNRSRQGTPPHGPNEIQPAFQSFAKLTGATVIGAAQLTHKAAVAKQGNSFTAFRRRNICRKAR